MQYKQHLPIQLVTSKIIKLGEHKVILDMDVAELYGVETKRINAAVKRNPEKFPEGYILQLTAAELELLRSQNATTKLNKTRSIPKAFTEKGLYMLATILKSNTATQMTIAIIEAFTKLRTLSNSINELSQTSNKSKQKNIINKSGAVISDLLTDELQVTNQEISMEINLSVVKFKMTTKKSRKK